MVVIRDYQQQPTSARKAIKRLLLKRPDLTVEEIEDALRRQGFDPTPTRVAIASIRRDFKATLKLLHAEGLIVNRSRRTS
jgi:Fe2+ or Zn2+ uptake regulation protein